jgi:hypothetical protein
MALGVDYDRLFSFPLLAQAPFSKLRELWEDLGCKFKEVTSGL